MLLLNPSADLPRYADARFAEIMRKTVDFFETMGKKKLKQDDQRAHVVRRVPRVSEARGDLRHAADAARVRRRRHELGHLEDRRLQRAAGVLRVVLLVHVAGVDPRVGADLDERQRGGEAVDRAAAARGRHLRLRPVREGARRRHLLDRDGADAAARRHVPRERREVLHRQRQPGGAGVDVRQAGGQRRVRVLRRRLAAREVRVPEEHRQQPVVGGELRAARLPDHARRHPRARPGRLGRGAQHRQRRQVQPRLGVDRHLHARLLRGDPPRLAAAACTATR